MRQQKDEGKPDCLLALIKKRQNIYMQFYSIICFNKINDLNIDF